jgi:hypothetical protein
MRGSAIRKGRSIQHVNQDWTVAPDYPGYLFDALLGLHAHVCRPLRREDGDAHGSRSATAPVGHGSGWGLELSVAIAFWRSTRLSGLATTA